MKKKYQQNAFKFGQIVAAKKFSNQMVVTHQKINIQQVLKLKHIFILINEQLIPFFIENIVSQSATESLMVLSEIMNYDTLKKYLQHEVWILETDMKNLGISNNMGWLNFMLINQKNEHIGEILDMQEISVQTLINVRYKKKEVLIPVHKENIIEIDQKNKTLKLNIVEGLLDV